MSFDANISTAELKETYFVAFQRAVESPSPPHGYMCSCKSESSACSH